VLVHLGSSNYLERYKIYVSHVREWRQQFDKVESVDLRYDRQIIVNPELQGTVKQTPLSILSVKAAMAAGMKPAALITHQVMAPKPSAVLTDSGKPPAKIAAGKKTVKKHRRVVAKATPKPTTALAQNKNTSKADSSPTPTPSAQPGTVTAKPGNKPSPAIAKGEDHP
jgi:cell division protein FtsQ